MGDEDEEKSLQPSYAETVAARLHPRCPNCESPRYRALSADWLRGRVTRVALVCKSCGWAWTVDEKA